LSAWGLINNSLRLKTELATRAKIRLTILLITLGALGLTACANPSYTISGNETNVSMLITAFLPNGALVELSLDNNVSSKIFKPESFEIRVEESTLLVVYDARSSGSSFPGIGMEEIGDVFRNDPAKYLMPLILFAAGLVLLFLNIVGSRRSENELLKNVEDGGVPPEGSSLSEEALLLLASRNPEAYRRVLEMVLKGELKVERRGWFREVLLKIKRLISR